MRSRGPAPAGKALQLAACAGCKLGGWDAAAVSGLRSDWLSKYVARCRVAAVTDLCDWPKEAGSRSKAVRCTVDCTALCPGAAQLRSTSAPSTAIVDVDLLARENPGLVLAQESSHACCAGVQHVAEVSPTQALA